MWGVVGYIGAVCLISFGPVNFDLWTEVGLMAVAAGIMLRD